jgi:membrane-associated phospholipid phosphatase
MKKTLAHIFSWLFLPLLMPFYGLYLSLYIPSEEFSLSGQGMYQIPIELKSQLLIIFFIFSALAPGISFYLLHKRKIISTIDIEDSKERNFPLLIMFAYCMVLFSLFIFKAPNNILPKYLYALPLSGAIVTAVFMFINRWVKISLHGGGAGILVGYLSVFMLENSGFSILFFAIAIIASGLCLSSRLFLQRHTPLEVYSGWLLALIITFICCSYYPIN